MTEKNIERELAEKWMKAAVEYGDQAKALSEQLSIWQNHFLCFANHKFDCAGNDGTVCECGYLRLWQKAVDACEATQWVARNEEEVEAIVEAFTPSKQEANLDWLRREMRDLKGAMSRLEATIRAGEFP